MIVDIYTHIFPDRFFQELERGSPKLGNMGKRLRSVRKLFDLDLRFKDMDAIGEDYRQIISLPNPPIEDIAEGDVAKNLARVANDSMAELCARHPDRFPAFAAAVSMHDVDFSIAEAGRAIKMGARGVQTFTNIAGHPLDEPRFRPFFAAMAAHDLRKAGRELNAAANDVEGMGRRMGKSLDATTAAGVKVARDLGGKLVSGVEQTPAEVEKAAKGLERELDKLGRDIKPRHK